MIAKTAWGPKNLTNWKFMFVALKLLTGKVVIQVSSILKSLINLIFSLEFCILSVRNGHFGKAGQAIEVEGNQTGCVAWTNTYGVPPGTKKWKKKHNFTGKL